jgi:hypothetical protein
VPSSLSPYGNDVPGNQLLPASFYLSAKPLFFGTVSWPAIGPDVTGGDMDYSGHAKKIPARVCFELMPDDGAYPSSNPRIKSFNANSCYPVP